MSQTYKTKQERKAEAKVASSKNSIVNNLGKNVVCAIYTRVSTEEQAKHYSLDYQELQCKEFIKTKGWDPDKALLYQDPGFSGKSDNRPAFQRMVYDAQAGKFQVLVIHKLDRFMRNMVLCSQYLQKIVQDFHIPVFFFGDNLMFENEVEMSIQLTMFSWFADYYVKNLSKETAKGKYSKASKGMTNGAAPFGYVKDDKGYLLIEPEEAEAVKMAFESYSTGLYSDQQIADILNKTGFKTKRGHIFSKDTVTGMLQNVTYEGLILYTGIKANEKDVIMFQGLHDPIITPELFDKCMNVRMQKNSNPIRDKHLGTPDVSDRFMLQGILVCASCGRKMRTQSRKDHHDFRYLESKSVKGDPCTYQKKSKPIISRIPELQVSMIIDSLILPDEWLSVIQKEIAEKNDSSAIDEQIERIERRISLLTKDYQDFCELYTQEERDDNIMTRKKLYDELRMLKAQQSQNAMELDYSQILVQSLKDYFHKGTMTEKSQICHLLFEKILFDHASQKVVGFLPSPDFLGLFNAVSAYKNWEIGSDNIIRI